MPNITSIQKVMAREFKHIFANKRLLTIILIVPIFYTLLFGYLYSTHIVKGIRTAVVDNSKTQLSQSLIESFNKSDRFELVNNLSTMSQLEDYIEKGIVDAGIVIPDDFTQNIYREEKSPVLIVVNGSNLIFSNSVTTNALGIIQSVSTGIAAKRVEASGKVSFDKAVNEVNPLSFRIRTWYNPTYNYSNFLLLGLIATAIQQVTLLYVAVCMASEKEKGTIKELEAMSGGPFAKVVGKSLPYIFLNLSTLICSIVNARVIFKVPFRGSIIALLILALVFMITIVSLGVFLSLICKNELEATQISMLIAIPSFLFSGYTWPIQAMPVPCRFLASILPLTYFAPAVRKIAIMGLGINGIKTEILVLCIMSLILFPLAVYVYKAKYSIKGYEVEIV